MARPRTAAKKTEEKPKQEKDMLDSRTVTGYEGPEPVQVELVPEGGWPAEYDDADESWKNAFNHAARKRNTLKACLHYADDHVGDHDA